MKKVLKILLFVAVQCVILIVMNVCLENYYKENAKKELRQELRNAFREGFKDGMR